MGVIICHFGFCFVVVQNFLKQNLVLLESKIEGQTIEAFISC